MVRRLLILRWALVIEVKFKGGGGGGGCCFISVLLSFDEGGDREIGSGGCGDLI